ncbi:UNC93-like protein MFSD11 [Liolophura sinensis]|uniref:UNC93-like protein MFSD11 n=1 Tax=Liolophura sinensis TaxID=3198878 RepID=UPI003158F42C
MADDVENESEETPTTLAVQGPAKYFDIRFYNIIVLGVAFMLVFTAFQTASMAEESVLQSAQVNSSFTGDGYTSLAIIYSMFSLSNWAAPSILSLIGPKLCMIVGAVMYFLFILQFLKPMTWALYTGSVLVGFGAAILWTGQGNFLTINSDTETVGRNSGIFWALLQCSLLFGNLYSYLTLRGNFDIPVSERTKLFLGLSGACGLGILTLVLLRKRRERDSNSLIGLNASKVKSDTPLEALKRSFHLLKTREMLFLSLTFAYTGLELTFFSGVYGTCVGHTQHFGNDAKGLLGISGMFIGAGEIIAGTMFGLFGSRTNKYGRDPIVLVGYVLHMAAFYLIFINLPSNSPLQSTMGSTYIEANVYVAILCSFLLGFGDASFNTQLYSLLGFMFPEDSAPAFALYKFVQSVAAAIGFAYSLQLLLHWQLLILVVTGTLGAYAFCVIEWSCNRAAKEGYIQI